MKFRYKRIIYRSVIFLWTILLLGLFIEYGILYIFLGVIAIFIVVIIFRYKNYIELDDIGVKQVKYRFFKKKVRIIPYKEIRDIEIKSNHTLSKEDIGNHCIGTTSGEKMEFGKIFYFGKFKDILKEKIKGKNINISSEIGNYIKYADKTSPDYFPLSHSTFDLCVRFLIYGFLVYYIFRLMIDIVGNISLDSITVGQYMIFLIPTLALSVFVGYNQTKKRPFVMLNDKSLIIAQNADGKYKIQKIPYANIEKIEIYIPGNIIFRIFVGICAYITLKGKDTEKEIILKDGEAFQEALKRKGIDVKFV